MAGRKQSGPQEDHSDIPSPAGRKKIPIDEDLLWKLASIQCTDGELGAIFECHQTTLSRRYRDLIDEARMAGHASLRRAQWIKAVHEGHPAMLIFLGKNYLGMADNPNAPKEDAATTAALIRDALRDMVATTVTEPESSEP